MNIVFGYQFKYFEAIGKCPFPLIITVEWHHNNLNNLKAIYLFLKLI